jgi:hypothetical protein
VTESLLPTERPGFAGVPLRFRVPDEFTEIVLTETPQARMDRTFAAFRQSLPQLTDVEVLNVVLRQEAMVMQLVQQSAVYAGTCVARTEEDVARVVVAQLSVLVKKMELDADDPLSAVAGSLRRPGVARDVGFLDLPAGKALMVAEESVVELPTTLTGEPKPNRHRVRQVQATIPFPDKRKGAIVSISSESDAGWPEYLEIFGKVLGTVSFQPPAERVRIETTVP